MKWKFLVIIIIIATLLSSTFIVVNYYSIVKSKESIDNEPGELEIKITWSDKSNFKKWTYATDWIIATITNNLNSSQDVLVEWSL